MLLLGSSHDHVPTLLLPRSRSGVLTAPVAAAVNIAKASSQAKQLLGLDAAQELEIADWLEAACRFDALTLLGKLDGVLLARTYLAGASFTLADIVVFAAVLGAI